MSPPRVVIVGSGPAGHTAAIYLARANLAPVMYEGFMAGGVAAGGQLTTTTDVENYPGFPEGINGFELMDRFRQQSERFGTVIHTETIKSVDFSTRPFRLYREDALDTDAPVLADAVLLATGATAKRLGIPGETEYWNAGISACAVCDGALPMFRNKELVVIGGGDTAAEEALFLTRYGSKVHLLVRRDRMRASKIMQQRVMAHEKIQIHWTTAAVEALGDGKRLNKLIVKSTVSGEQSELPADGLFYAIGHEPNTAFVKNDVALDSDGYVLVGAQAAGQGDHTVMPHGRPATMTSVEGVFACGDVVDKKYRQAITAAGSGCMAALESAAWLESQEFEQHGQS